MTPVEGREVGKRYNAPIMMLQDLYFWAAFAAWLLAKKLSMYDIFFGLRDKRYTYRNIFLRQFLVWASIPLLLAPTGASSNLAIWIIFLTLGVVWAAGTCFFLKLAADSISVQPGTRLVFPARHLIIAGLLLGAIMAGMQYIGAEPFAFWAIAVLGSLAGATGVRWRAGRDYPPFGIAEEVSG